MSIEFISINPKIPRIINKVEKKVSGWVREKSCEIKMGFWDGTLRKVSPLDETALARQFEFSALSGLETSQLRPMMTGPTESQDRRGLKLQRIASIHRQIAYFYRKIAFCPSQSAFSHQAISIIHHRDREFPRSNEGARTPRETWKQK